MASEQTTPSKAAEAGALDVPLDELQVADDAYWEEGAPNDLFERLRGECPVHWSAGISRVPGGGRLLVGHDGRRRPRRQPRLEDVLVRPSGITALTHSVLPLELQQAMFIGMDPPKHDRLKALFQRGSPRSGSTTTRTRSARSRSTCSTSSTTARPATSSATSPSRSSHG